MKLSTLSSDDDPTRKARPTERPARLGLAAKRGAVLGFAVGLLALGGVLVVVGQCLPFHISFPPPPWPWYCSDPAYVMIGYLAFPVNLFTNDLARAILLAPLSLLLYILLGALVGLALSLSRSSAITS
jgi:hypothetical protein